MAAHRDAFMALEGFIDGAVESGADVGQDLLTIDRGRQPGQRPGTGGHRHRGNGGELGTPRLRFGHSTLEGPASRGGAIDPDDDAPHRRVVGALVVPRNDDGRAVAVRRQGGGDGSQEPVGEATASSGADDGQCRFLGEVDENPGGVPGLQGGGDGDAGLLDALNSLVNDGLGTGPDG